MDTLLPFSLLPLILIFLSLSPLVLSIGLPCSASGSTCSALVSFVTTTPTNLSTIVSTFDVKNYRDLLGANAWELSVSQNTTLPQNVMIKVPITCSRNNGSGISKDGPIYTVKKDDSLSIIATQRYGGLLIYQDIVAVNSEITNPDQIQIGQKFRIPLPCTCQSESETNGSSSSANLHYSYVVQKGNSLDGIAAEMGSNASVLMRLNNITNATLLQAGQVIDVPLKACSSNIANSSGETDILVANGTYVITAGNCLQCSCVPSDLDLYCAPAPLGASCSSMQCKNSNLMIGNFSTQQTTGGCNVTECSYNGYVNDKILTTLETSHQPQCPAKHILPAWTTPSTLPTVLPPASSPGMSPNGSPQPKVPGLPSSSPSPSGSTNSMAVEPLKSFSLATMLVLGIPFLIL